MWDAPNTTVPQLDATTREAAMDQETLNLPRLLLHPSLATIPNHKGQILQDRNREPKTTSRRCLINNRDKRSVGTEYREDNAS
jgi:hypothetical protein